MVLLMMNEMAPPPFTASKKSSGTTWMPIPWASFIFELIFSTSSSVEITAANFSWIFVPNFPPIRWMMDLISSFDCFNLPRMTNSMLYNGGFSRMMRGPSTPSTSSFLTAAVGERMSADGRSARVCTLNFLSRNEYSFFNELGICTAMRAGSFNWAPHLAHSLMLPEHTYDELASTKLPFLHLVQGTRAPNVMISVTWSRTCHSGNGNRKYIHIEKVRFVSSSSLILKHTSLLPLGTVCLLRSSICIQMALFVCFFNLSRILKYSSFCLASVFSSAADSGSFLISFLIFLVAGSPISCLIAL